MTNIVDSAGLQSNRTRRRFLPGGLIVTERQEPLSGYLIESGVVAVSVALDRTPPTCVELLSAGTLFGLPAAADPNTFGFRAVSSVNLLEISPGLLQQALRRQPALRDAYLWQLRERVVQTELVAACNAHHALAGRCARWLLRLHAHLGPVLPVTHAFLATMLGVRRAGISITLEVLQRGGLIRQRRGSIEVLDTAALAPYACPCPDTASNPAHVITADMINAVVVDSERPRVWLDREIKVPATIVVPGGERWARREAALRLCRSVVAHSLTALEQ